MLQPASDFHFRKDLAELPASAYGGESSNYSADLREIIKVVNRRRWVIITTTLALLAAATVFLLVATPRYTIKAIRAPVGERSSIRQIACQIAAAINSAKNTDDMKTRW